MSDLTMSVKNATLYLGDMPMVSFANATIEDLGVSLPEVHQLRNGNFALKFPDSMFQRNRTSQQIQEDNALRAHICVRVMDAVNKVCSAPGLSFQLQTYRDRRYLLSPALFFENPEAVQVAETPAADKNTSDAGKYIAWCAEMGAAPAEIPPVIEAMGDSMKMAYYAGLWRAAEAGDLLVEGAEEELEGETAQEGIDTSAM